MHAQAQQILPQTSLLNLASQANNLGFRLWVIRTLLLYPYYTNNCKYQ